MDFCARRTLALFFLLFKSALGHDTCTKPRLNTSALDSVKTNGHGSCILLRKTCADDGMLVTYDDSLVADNLTRANPYGVLEPQSGLWNFPARGGCNSDALVGHQPNSWVPIRSASRLEASPHLQRPVFSTCTLPVVITTDWPYNMGEVFAQLASIADVYFRQKGMIDDRATLVLATPDGLAPTTFHHVMLSPYSRYPLISFDDLSQRPVHDHRVPWAAEGHHVSCFDRVVYCKLQGFPQGILPTSEVLLRHIGPHLPVDPLGFSNPSAGPATPGGPVPVGSDTTLRVVLESRSGPARNIRNLPQIIQACEEANRRGFRAGSFDRISCKILHTGDTPELHGVQRFYTTVAAVRAAHVLVTVHGAGAANCFFLELNNGGTALLELRACRFGTKYCGWPNAYMQMQLRNAGFPIRFFSYNVEDTAQCAPSDYEALALSSPGSVPMPGGEDMRARDQHLTLRPAPFLAMLQHIGSVLRNNSAWQAGDHEGWLHGYAVPEGLLLGPLCVEDVAKHMAGGGRLIRV